MGYKNKEAYNAYMKEYMLKRYHSRRAEAIEYLGGECKVCSTIESLEIDHIDASDKSFNVAKIWSYSKKKFYTEIDKCQLLCGDCHKDKHSSLYPCGTPHRYWRGCRCKDCTKANTDYCRKYKQARG